MVITEQQLFDYISCPALYDFRHNKNIRIIDPVSMPKLLKKVAKYFYFNLLGGKVPSGNDLKKKWDSICNINPDYIDAKKNLEGLGFIMKLLQWASGEQIIVIDIDSQYNLNLSSTSTGPIELIGNMGTILALPGDSYELLVTDFSNKLPDQTLVDMKLKYTLDNYAFKSVYKKPIAGIRIRNVRHAKDYLTTRTDDDYRRLEATVINVSRCIKDNIYYPRESIMCVPCTAKDYCKVWN